MWQTDFSLFSDIPDKKAYLPALIGAAVCLLMLRIGILSFFFLVPLGFVSFRYEQKIAWAAFFLTIAGNAILTLGTAVRHGFPIPETAWNLMYVSLMVLIFAWIIAPPDILAEKVTGLIRFITGSCLGALMFIVFFFRLLESEGFLEYVGQLINMMIAQNARLDIMTAETVISGVKGVMLRGGSLISCVLLFISCRQISCIFARIIPGKKSSAAPETRYADIIPLAGFQVPYKTIWVFSSSLFLVVAARIANLEIPEIILWNILVLCIILYLAQGLGIMLFFISLPSTPPFMRIIILFGFFLLLFSPVLNVILLGAFVLLGIAEIWAPFRAPKQSAPPSTPESE